MIADLAGQRRAERLERHRDEERGDRRTATISDSKKCAIPGNSMPFSRADGSQRPAIAQALQSRDRAC